jgi:two-component system sensor histidine kinase/response regulator
MESVSIQSSSEPLALPAIINPADIVILIADDLQDNLNIVKAVLGYKGYRVETAKNGKQVLEEVAKQIPDLILLDIQMPEMNGFEACRHLKANPEYKEIPIIFLTAKADSYDIVDGFKHGAVDYITKPFNTMELLARVQTHLELKRSRDLLAEKNKYLEIMTVGLTKLNNEKNDFMEIAAHDLKNPLTTIRGLADFLRRDFDLAPTAGIKLMLENIVKSSERMFSIIHNLMDVSAIEEGSFRFDATPVDVGIIVRDLTEQYQYQADVKRISLQLDIPPHIVATIHGNFDTLTQVLDNLLSNAVKYSPDGTTVAIRLSKNDSFVRCEVQDEGVGISETDRNRLFGKFVQLSTRPTGNEASTGLGLYIAKKLTEAMNGTIQYLSEPGKGSTFILEFPALTS